MFILNIKQKLIQSYSKIDHSKQRCSHNSDEAQFYLSYSHLFYLSFQNTVIGVMYYRGNLHLFLYNIISVLLQFIFCQFSVLFFPSCLVIYFFCITKTLKSVSLLKYFYFQIPEPLYSALMDLQNKGISPRVPVFTTLCGFTCIFLIVPLFYLKVNK